MAMFGKPVNIQTIGGWLTKQWQDEMERRQRGINLLQMLFGRNQPPQPPAVTNTIDWMPPAPTQMTLNTGSGSQAPPMGTGGTASQIPPGMQLPTGLPQAQPQNYGSFAGFPGFPPGILQKLFGGSGSAQQKPGTGGNWENPLGY